MKNKNKSIFLLILICIGVFLLGSVQVWAAIDVTDNACSPDELVNNLCIEAFGYVVQVYVDDVTTNPIGSWPIEDAGTGNLEFRYRASVNDASVCKSATWNYFVQDMAARVGSSAVDYVLDTDPPGAQLLLPGDTIPKCTGETASIGHNLVKLNPSLNCADGNEVIFSFIAAPGTPTSLCNRSLVTTKRGCEGGYLQGPGYGVSGFIEDQTFNCSDYSVTVQYDKCSGEPTQVDMTAKGGAPAIQSVCNSTYGDADYPHAPDDYVPLHVGPGGVGAAFCMDPPPPIYFYNQSAWYGILTGTCPQ